MYVSSLAEPLVGLPAARRQRRALHARAHRPWPLPAAPWVMGQTWEDLLFAHWRVAPERLRELVPRSLELEVYAGAAWVGITPFRVRALHLRGLPPLPVGSTFPELNVRTYVRVGDRPGILFFSLDAASPVAVAAARLAYRLPYHRARMALDRRGSRIAFRSVRDRARLVVEYEPLDRVFEAAPGTLEHFLYERYCLYTASGGKLLRADIHHPPWPLQRAGATVRRNTMTLPLGLDLTDEEPLLHFAARQDVVIWAPTPVRAA
jgi:uncharacterized protein YqjF (DUF2071 family)